jgi:hypothetical protein
MANGALMNRIVTAALVAAATTATSWAVSYWLDVRRARAHAPRIPMETWENEGGALAPHHAAVETSQVPR